jgi:anti-sigma B factor antagonist
VLVDREIDVHTVPRIREYVVGTVETDPHSGRLIVDLTDTTFIDSTGLGLLVGIQKRICARVGALRLVIPNPDIRRIFLITGLHQVFPISQSTQAAMT